MDGLSWNSFHQQAQVSICKNCSCGSKAPWRGNATCLQAWLRYHSTRGITLACHSSRSESERGRREDEYMKVYSSAV